MFYSKLSIAGVSLLMVALSLGCKNGESHTANDTAKTDTLPPVETKKPNSQYKPAFEGQTRIAGVETKTPLNIEVIDSSLKAPWAISVLPDGRLLITENKGEMSILTADGKPDKKITGLPKVDADGQGGLLDVTIDPDFEKNRMIYWDYSEPGDEGSLLAVAKGKLSADETKIENTKVIYRAKPAFTGKLQYGSRIVFDEDGNLFVSTGERSDKKIRVQAQELNSGLGKVVHITKDGKPVPNGPFAKTPNALPEIYAYGFRNPEGMTMNPETNELWEVEFGPKGGDEVNIVKPGKNYGWPVITYGIEYSGEKVGDGIQQKDGMEQPVYYWDPVVSPAGMTFYSGANISEWKGNLFIACLSSSHVVRLVIEDNKVVGEEWLLEDLGQRFRAIAEGKNGALYVASDGGKLYRITKK